MEDCRSRSGAGGGDESFTSGPLQAASRIPPTATDCTADQHGRRMAPRPFDLFGGTMVRCVMKLSMCTGAAIQHGDGERGTWQTPESSSLFLFPFRFLFRFLFRFPFPHIRTYLTTSARSFHLHYEQHRVAPPGPNRRNPRAGTEAPRRSRKARTKKALLAIGFAESPLMPIRSSRGCVDGPAIIADHQPTKPSQITQQR